MQSLLITGLIACLWAPVSAQLFDDFSDGDIAENPTWTGDTQDFIVNGELQLQLNAAAAGVSTIWTEVTYPDSVRWSLDFTMDFAPSSSNMLRIVLYANSTDVATASGYALEIGENGSDDALHLVRFDAGNEITVASGPGIFGDDPAQATLDIERTSSGLWTARADMNGTETSLFSTTDAGLSPSGATVYGIMCTYSETRKDRFFFDNIQIEPLIPDVTAPVLESVTIDGSDRLSLQFNEVLNAGSIIPGNFEIDGGLGNPVNASLASGDPTRVELILAGVLQNNTTYIVSASNISDLSGNIAGVQSISFDYIEPTVPGAFDLLITEVMADPSPPIGLPNAEYLEIHNRSEEPFRMADIRLRVGSNTISLPDTLIGPGEYVIVSDDSDAADFRVYGKVIPVPSLPALTNSGTQVELLGTGDLSLHLIDYDLTWYADPSKDEGGWSLELINPNSPCALASNWRASESLSGGTPGQQNSVIDLSQPDVKGPRLLSLFPDPAGGAIVLTFDEVLGSTLPGLSLEPSAGDIVVASGGSIATLLLSEGLLPETIYTLTIQFVADCIGNVSDPVQVSFGLPSDPEAGDLLINELLFDPQTGGVRYLELFNTSNKFISTTDFNVFERREDETDVRVVLTEFLIAPASFVVLCDEPSDVIARYPTNNPDVIIVSDLPAFDCNGATVGVIDKFGMHIDSFPYTDDLHNPLVDDTDGVALERISLVASALDADNWQSAARAVGYGTPGLPNSQMIPTQTGEGVFEVINSTFSPDEDGFEDFTVIRFLAPGPGSLGTIRVFDALGREVRQIMRNEVLGIGSLAQWDGSTREGIRAPMGIYILLIETFDAEGNTQKFKVPIVLATRL